MKCGHKKWKTLVKGRAWKCRDCGYIRTKHGEVVSLAAMRDLIHNHK